jgi:hypothetical protein
MEQDAKVPISLHNILADATSPSPASKPTYRAHHAQSVPRTENLVRSKDVSTPITTMMLRNIPNKYTQAKLLQEIDDCGFQGSYNFFYLPMDVHNRSNVGYAFVNFVTDSDAARFQAFFCQHCFLLSNRRKIGLVSHAHVQGLDQNIRHFENRAVTHAKNDQYRPVVIKNKVRISFDEAVAEARMATTESAKVLSSQGSPASTATPTPRANSPASPAMASVTPSAGPAANTWSWEPCHAPGLGAHGAASGGARQGLELAIANHLASQKQQQQQQSYPMPNTPPMTYLAAPAMRAPPGLDFMAQAPMKSMLGDPCYVNLPSDMAVAYDAHSYGEESGAATPRTNALALRMSYGGGMVLGGDNEIWESL